MAEVIYKVRITEPNDGPYKVGEEVESTDAKWLIHLGIAEGVNEPAKAFQAALEKREQERRDRVQAKFDAAREQAAATAQVIKQLRTEEFGKQLTEGT